MRAGTEAHGPYDMVSYDMLTGDPVWSPVYTKSLYISNAAKKPLNTASVTRPGFTQSPIS